MVVIIPVVVLVEHALSRYVLRVSSVVGVGRRRRGLLLLLLILLPIIGLALGCEGLS